MVRIMAAINNHARSLLRVPFFIVILLFLLIRYGDAGHLYAYDSTNSKTMPYFHLPFYIDLTFLVQTSKTK